MLSLTNKYYGTTLKYHLYVCFFFLILIYADGCIVNNNYSSAIDKGFEDINIKSNGFDIKALIKSKGNGSILTVYIEGDGLAWKNKYTPSRDPTPKRSLTLQLATLDPNLKITYLARPCHYSGEKNVKCRETSMYWTSHRYSFEIVNAMNNALNRLKELTETDTIHLIGFSGGGTIAVLLASFRKDIATIVTIAANLDHEQWTTLHEVTPLYASLNAADYAEKIQFIPQIHFVGGRDTNVNESVVRAYFNRMSNHSLTRIIVMEKYSHTCCWIENWQRLLQTYL